MVHALERSQRIFWLLLKFLKLFNNSLVVVPVDSFDESIKVWTCAAMPCLRTTPWIDWSEVVVILITKPEVVIQPPFRTFRQTHEDDGDQRITGEFFMLTLPYVFSQQYFVFWMKSWTEDEHTEEYLHTICYSAKDAYLSLICSKLFQMPSPTKPQ